MNNVSIKKATIINFVGKYSNVLVQLILNSILARLLTPNEFGVVAIITVFINFFTMLADLGIGPAIIQNKKLQEKEISDIFIFTFFAAVIVSIVFAIFSFPLSFMYNNNVYISLGGILSFSILFNILNIVPNALLLKQKKFKTLGIRTVIITIVGGILTIILALNGAKYYSLVISSVLVAILTFCFNFYATKIKIYPKFNWNSIKKIREFSSYQLGFNFINYFSRNLDNLLIGKFLGEVPLGYYDKAYKLMLYPVQNLTHGITPVLHPILSEYQNERDMIYKSYIKLVKILSLLGIFASVFCFFATKEIIIIMFGEQWIRSIPAFRILSLSIWPQMITGMIGAIFQSTGETKKLFNTGIINTIITIGCILIGLSLGSIEYISIGVVISYILNLFIAFHVLITKIFRKSLLDFYSNLISSIVICGIVIVIYYCIPLSSSNYLLSTILKFIKVSIGYCLGLFITKEYTFLKKIIVK